MNKETKSAIGFFEKYLTLWVIICMLIVVSFNKGESRILVEVPVMLVLVKIANKTRW